MSLIISVGFPVVTLPGTYKVKSLTSEEARQVVSIYDPEQTFSLIPDEDSCHLINAALDTDLEPFNGNYIHDKNEVVLVFTETGWYQASFIPE